MRLRDVLPLLLVAANAAVFVLGSLPPDGEGVKPVISARARRDAGPEGKGGTVRFLDPMEALRSPKPRPPATQSASVEPPAPAIAPDPSRFVVIGHLVAKDGSLTYYLRDRTEGRVIDLSASTQSPRLLGQNGRALIFEYQGRTYEATP